MEGYTAPEEYVLKTEEILKFLDKFILEEYKTFSFGGFNFQIIFLDEDDLDADGDIFWSTSTEITGYDIYILKSLSKDIKRRRLFHELLEIDLLQQGVSSDESHSIVQVEEEKVFGKREE